MDIQDIRVPYEILIRFDDAGKPKGAHVCYRRVLKMGDEVLKDAPLPAEPLSMDDFPTSGLMTDVTREALARVTSLADEVRAKDEALSALQQTLAEPS